MLKSYDTPNPVTTLAMALTNLGTEIPTGRYATYCDHEEFEPGKGWLTATVAGIREVVCVTVDACGITVIFATIGSADPTNPEENLTICVNWPGWAMRELCRARSTEGEAMRLAEKLAPAALAALLWHDDAPMARMEVLADNAGPNWNVIR